MCIKIRPARLDDIKNIIPLLIKASGGITEFLLEDYAENIDDLIEIALLDENTSIFYENIIVAEIDREVKGIANYYPSEHHCVPDVMRALISKTKIDALLPYLTTHVPNSMYIHALAVSSNNDNHFIALCLTKFIEKKARTLEKKCLSAHIWQNNSSIFEALSMSGFIVVENLDIPHHNAFTFNGGMSLLKGPELL